MYNIEVDVNILKILLKRVLNGYEKLMKYYFELKVC